MQITNLQLKKYLLGSLDESSNEGIGLQILSDERLEEQLLIAENDLMEDFLDKNLSSEEVKLFQENFLVCNDREKQLNEISLFRQYSKKQVQSENLLDRTGNDSKTFWEKIKDLSIFNLDFAVPVLAVLIVAAVGFYFLFSTNQLSPLEKEYAQLNNNNFGNINEFSKFTNVSLISGTLRSSDALKKLKAENLSDQVFFSLAMPFNLPDNETLKAELVKDQKTVFRQPGIKIYKNQNGQEIRLLLPKTILTKGQYQIKIENPQTKDSPVIYNFAVE